MCIFVLLQDTSLAKGMETVNNCNYEEIKYLKTNSSIHWTQNRKKKPNNKKTTKTTTRPTLTRNFFKSKTVLQTRKCNYYQVYKTTQLTANEA